MCLEPSESNLCFIRASNQAPIHDDSGQLVHLLPTAKNTTVHKSKFECGFGVRQHIFLTIVFFVHLGQCCVGSILNRDPIDGHEAILVIVHEEGERGSSCEFLVDHKRLGPFTMGICICDDHVGCALKRGRKINNPTSHTYTSSRIRDAVW